MIEKRKKALTTFDILGEDLASNPVLEERRKQILANLSAMKKDLARKLRARGVKIKQEER